MGLRNAEFGEKTAQFYRKACRSVHKKHLLVFYSIGFLIRAYMADSSRRSRQISDDE